jgi:hypothetical protein
MPADASTIQNFTAATQQVSTSINDLLQDLLDIKRDLTPDKERFVAQATSSLSNAQQQIIGARDQINQILQQKESIDEGIRDVVPLLVEYGYSRNMAAPKNEIWYAHPAGHQVHARPMPGDQAGVYWDYFDPDLRSVSRGFGSERLASQLGNVHRRDQKVNESAKVATSKGEADQAFKTSYRDFLVVQTATAPIERFEVREASNQYPHIISRHPQTGEWRDWTLEALGHPTDERYIQIVQRWIYLGKPLVKSTSTDSETSSLVGGTSFP